MNPDAPTPSAGICEPPAWLSERAADIFAALAATLDGMGLATPDDQFATAMLASRIAEVEHLTAMIEDGGHTYVTDAGLMKGNPAVRMRNEAMRHAQSLCNEFGLTPSARSKVAASNPKQPNPFAALD